jgi:hypothetical protein
MNCGDGTNNKLFIHNKTQKCNISTASVFKLLKTPLVLFLQNIAAYMLKARIVEPEEKSTAREQHGNNM